MDYRQPPTTYQPVPAAPAARRRGALLSRVVLGAVVVCALGAGGYGIASATSAHGTGAIGGQSLASAPASSKTGTTKPPAPPVRPPLQGLGGPFPGRSGFFGAGAASGGTVTAVGADTITVENEFGRYLTVKTNSSTTYSENGKQVTRSALATGEQVVFSRMLQRASGTAASAAVGAVEIVLPSVSGKVVSTSASQIVVEQSDGLYVTVDTSTTGTTYTEAGQTVSSSEVTTGTVVSVTGTVDADHTEIDATTVEIVLPSISGRVSAVSGSTITVSSFGGSTYSVATGTATKFRKMPGDTSTTIGSVSKGDIVEVLGSYGSGDSFTAKLVEIGPSLSAPRPVSPSGGKGPGRGWPVGGPSQGGFPGALPGGFSQAA